MATAVRPEPKPEERRIDPEMSVREINARYPSCRAVFAQHGMGGCGGDLGPDEPLAFFAAAHGVDFSALLSELEYAAAQEVPDTVSPALDFEKALARVYQAFIKSAILIALSAGTAWGAYILAQIALQQSFQAPSYAGTQAHGHAQIFGWVALFIMGVAYFSVPKLVQARMRSLAPAWTVLGLMLAGIGLRVLGSVAAGLEVLVPVSSALELVAAALFISDLELLFYRSRQLRANYELFIHASLASLLLLSLWNFGLTVEIWRDSGSVIPAAANSKFLYLAVFGFIINMILGYSLRLLPIFLGLKATRQPLVVPAFALFNAGAVARVLDWSVGSGLLTFSGMLVYLAALRVFEAPAGTVKSRGVDDSFPWFIRLSYTWFAVATAMVLGGDLYRWLTGGDAPHIYVGSWRHAVTVGFITTIMVGLGYRLLPIFGGVDLWRPGWMRVSFWLLAVGNTTRVVFELATGTGAAWTYRLMGISGLLELAALSLFAVSIWKTLNTAQQVLYSQEQISGSTHLRWLLANFPQAREELIRAGFHHLQQVKTVPPFVSLEQAANVHGLDVDRVVERLRAALGPAVARPSQPVQLKEKAS